MWAGVRLQRVLEGIRPRGYAAGMPEVTNVVQTRVPPGPPGGTWKGLVGLALFGIAFGYVEAAVVVYLRDAYEPLLREVRPRHSPSELFPLISPEDLERQGGPHLRRLKVEIGREAATLVMLAGVALAAARGLGFTAWLGAFVFAFGWWDIFYYLFLKLTIGWPASLLTFDVLFLIPMPWVGPVLAPILVSAAMIALGGATYATAAAGRSLKLSPLHWLMIVSGGAIIVASFCLESRQVMSGGVPRGYHWVVFAAGLGAGVVGWLGGWAAGRRQQA